MTANWLCGMNAHTRTLPRLVWWHHIRAGINGDGLLSTKICGLSSRGSSCEGTSCAASQPLSGTSSSCLHKTTRTRAEQAAAQPLCQTGLVRTVGCHQPLMLCPAHVERCGQPERRRRRGGGGAGRATVSEQLASDRRALGQQILFHQVVVQLRNESGSAGGRMSAQGWGVPRASSGTSLCSSSSLVLRLQNQTQRKPRS